MQDLAYVNGVFCPVSEAKVSIDDRGFQFGDGVYEVIAVLDGQPFLLDRHLARLHRSLAGIRLDYDFEANPIEPILFEGIERFGSPNTMVYIQITRGVAPRDHVFEPGTTPTVVMTFRPLPTVSQELRQRGVSLMTTPENRWANCYIKAITLLPNVLARTEARQKGFDDALFVTDGGLVREVTVANILAVCDGALRMPQRSEAILHGVTQSFLLDCAESIDMSVVEGDLTLEELMAADEAFLSGTLYEVLGVTRIDDKPIGDGTVGPATKKLLSTFHERMKAVLADASRTCAK